MIELNKHLSAYVPKITIHFNFAPNFTSKPSFENQQKNNHSVVSLKIHPSWTRVDNHSWKPLQQISLPPFQIRMEREISSNLNRSNRKLGKEARPLAFNCEKLLIRIRADFGKGSWDTWIYKMNRVYCRRRSSDVVRQKINHFASRPLLAKWPSINALVAIWHWRNRWRRLRSCPTHPSRDASLQPFLPSFLLPFSNTSPPPLTSDRLDETRRATITWRNRWMYTSHLSRIEMSTIRWFGRMDEFIVDRNILENIFWKNWIIGNL